MRVHWSIHALPELSDHTAEERRALFRRRDGFMSLAGVGAAPVAAVSTFLGSCALFASLKSTPYEPLGILALAAALPAGLGLGHLIDVNLFRSRVCRGLPGHCRECGYDLRATRGRCPECGAAVTGAATAEGPCRAA